MPAIETSSNWPRGSLRLRKYAGDLERFGDAGRFVFTLIQPRQDLCGAVDQTHIINHGGHFGTATEQRFETAEVIVFHLAAKTRFDGIAVDVLVSILVIGRGQDRIAEQGLVKGPGAAATGAETLVEVLGQDVLFRRTGRKQDMKMSSHQDKAVGREVGFEVHFAEGFAKNSPAFLGRFRPPAPVGESGIQMKKS